MFWYYCLVANVYMGQHRAKDFPSSCLEVHPLRAGAFPQQPKWTEMKGNEVSFWRVVVCSFFSAGHPGKVLWSRAQNAAPVVPHPSESDTSVELPAPAEVPLLFFKQACLQQTWLTDTQWRFKLDSLLITVAWFSLPLVPRCFHQKLSALLVLKA